MFKKIILLLILLSNSLFAMTDEELREYKVINFYDFISSYKFNVRNLVTDSSNTKKFELNSTFFTNYIYPVEKYITYLEYRGTTRRIDLTQRPFLIDWFRMNNATQNNNINNINTINKTMNINNSQDDNPGSILIDENLELFYTSTMYSTRGKNYFIITQKVINDSMQKELKAGELIKVYIWNLGEFNSELPVFLITGFEKVKIKEKDLEDEMFFSQYLFTLRRDILNRRFDKAKGNIELLLKKYPDNLNLKLNLCLIFNKTNFFDKAISCYKDVIKESPNNYDAYYGLSSSYYNSNKTTNNKERINNIIQNTTKAIELIQSRTTSPTGDIAMILYNSYYLRAMAKIENKDKSAIFDLTIINKNQPILVSNESLESFKKILNIK